MFLIGMHAGGTPDWGATVADGTPGNGLSNGATTPSRGSYGGGNYNGDVELGQGQWAHRSPAITQVVSI